MSKKAKRKRSPREKSETKCRKKKQVCGPSLTIVNKGFIVNDPFKNDRFVFNFFVVFFIIKR